ncbi:CoA-binding protein [Draconibacterium sp. IB214405]|uniref:CoA-binding protein n=1 Tax=Draconibacterium sp. IB214405 TaxID=3097352 RepID=UPI002A181501|nr:CoA-binding protein [Draconibacterium sp. IB214405]MDX8338489.1 CoA-binding protein [Draconibacterium sp. IB214405]
MSKRTLVIGASENPARYSNKAIHALRRNNHDVVALAKRNGLVDDVAIQTAFPGDEDIHTVTLYVGPQHQPEYYADIIQMKPQRVIFNPGTENPEFADKLEASGIQAEEACTLVLLSIGNY